VTQELTDSGDLAGAGKPVALGRSPQITLRPCCAPRPAAQSAPCAPSAISTRAHLSVSLLPRQHLHSHLCIILLWGVCKCVCVCASVCVRVCVCVCVCVCVFYTVAIVSWTVSEAKRECQFLNV